jgi:hypothetical protein
VSLELVSNPERAQETSDDSKTYWSMPQKRASTVQTAVWVSAEFEEKRVVEGWGRSMPVTAVLIDGHI